MKSPAVLINQEACSCFLTRKQLHCEQPVEKSSPIVTIIISKSAAKSTATNGAILDTVGDIIMV